MTISSSLTELTTIKQNVSTVSRSYEDLGAKLKEKSSELESMLGDLQHVQEESNSLREWLQKMDRTATKWETALDSSTVKAQVEQHKVLLSLTHSVECYQLRRINF